MRPGGPEAEVTLPEESKWIVRGVQGEDNRRGTSPPVAGGLETGRLEGFMDYIE